MITGKLRSSAVIITQNQVAIFRTAVTLQPIHPSRRSLQSCHRADYTAIVRGKNIIVGVALVEVYDLDQ